MKFPVFAVVLTSVFLTGAVARAEGVPFTPGKWEMKTTIEMPMMPEPRVMTSTECMEKSELSPADMMNQDRQGGCTVSDVVVDGNTVRWKVECANPAGPMRGEGELTSTGTSVQGRSSMTAQMEGHEMVFRTRWEGRRIGECD